jgi:hypothetical protein
MGGETGGGRRGRRRGPGSGCAAPFEIVHAGPRGRILVTDSVTLCDERVGPADVLVAGSFAGALSLGFALERGVRAVIAHAAGPGLDGAGISGLALADALGVPTAAVETMSARIGDGRSVLGSGVIAHVNAAAAALGVRPGMTAWRAARRLLGAPRGHPRPGAGLVDRTRRVVLEAPGGRVVLLGSMSFADATNTGDVLCAGSHAGRVNAAGLLERVRPRGAIFNDGGMARGRSGVGGLALLDEAGVPAAAVAAASARIGDAASTYETGVISAANRAARRRGVAIGRPAREAARAMLEP